MVVGEVDTRTREISFFSRGKGLVNILVDVSVHYSKATEILPRPICSKEFDAVEVPLRRVLPSQCGTWNNQLLPFSVSRLLILVQLW